MLKLGELFDGHVGWKMDMPEAHRNFHVKGHGHSSLLNADVFYDLGIFDVLKT